MANRTASFYLSEDALIKLDLIAMHRMTGMNSNRSAAVETIITETFANLKRIEPRRDGSKTIGWQAFYGDHLVTTTDGAGSKDQAQRALDAYVYEELSK